MQAVRAVAEPQVPAYFARPKNNLIGKDWVPAQTGKTISVADPSTGRQLLETPDSAKEDVHRAAQAARKAFESGPWPRLTPYERGRLLLKLADLIEKNQEELAQIEAVDAGKPIMQARYVDVPLSLQQYHFYAGLTTKIGGRTITPSTPYMANVKFHAYTEREPLGVAALITPFNFPLLLGSMKVAPALAAGCTIILKPDERAPASSLRLAELALEAGFPEGVFNVITGGPEAGRALAHEPLVDKIAFTGSTEAGREVLSAATGNLKKVSLELGGNSPHIIFKDADLGQAIATAGAAAFTNAGELCVAGARVFVEDAIYDEVLAGLIKYATELKIGPAFDDSTQLGPVITKEHLDKVMGLLETGRAEGARVLTGGQTVSRPGFFMQPTVVSDAGPRTRLMSEEVFGPVIKLARFRELGEVLAAANDTPFGLGAGVWTRDVSKAHRVASALKAGTVYVNCYSVFDPALPWGGYKQSGWGRESCPEALDLYTEVKTICLAL
jgi:phenylacetaldehyde dehydrogenase